MDKNELNGLSEKQVQNRITRGQVNKIDEDKNI